MGSGFLHAGIEDKGDGWVNQAGAFSPQARLDSSKMPVVFPASPKQPASGHDKSFTFAPADDADVVELDGIRIRCAACPKLTPRPFTR
jgi:hypothetical protein